VAALKKRAKWKECLTSHANVSCIY
jgi:hypothetical protein